MSETNKNSEVKLYKLSVIAVAVLAITAAVLFVTGTYNIAGGLLALSLAGIPFILYFQHLTSTRALRVIVRQELNKLPTPQVEIQGTIPTEQSLKDLNTSAQQLANAEKQLSRTADSLAAGSANAIQNVERESRVLRQTVKVLAKQQDAIIQELERSQAIRKNY